MGLPLVTLAGSDSAAAMAGRQGEALLKQIGRLEWVVSSQEEYLRLAEQLAHDPAGLAVIRSTQRAALQASELCNEAAFARDFLNRVQEASLAD